MERLAAEHGSELPDFYSDYNIALEVVRSCVARMVPHLSHQHD